MKEYPAYSRNEYNNQLVKVTSMTPYPISHPETVSLKEKDCSKT